MCGNKVLLDVFMACRARLARVVSRIVPPHEIEDVVQETYVLVCQFEAKNEISKPLGFMVRTARNLALDHVKRAHSRLTSSLDEDMEALIDGNGDATDQTFKQVESDEEFANFCEAVRQLPRQCRRVFVLKKVYGYSQKEIAYKLGITENTVERHVATGLKMCALYLLRRSESDGQAASGHAAVASQGRR